VLSILAQSVVPGQNRIFTKLVNKSYVAFVLTAKMALLTNINKRNYLLLEPLHGILLGQSVLESNLASLAAAVGHIESGSAEDNIEVKTIDTNAGVVLDAQVNVFLDAESKVSSTREIVSPQLVFSHLKQIFFI